MSSILTRVADSLGGFTPSKPREYLALQIARKLNDASAVRHYAVLFEHHPEERLVAIYRRCAKEGRLTGEQFMSEFRK
jgi:hypothetical protein